MNKKIDQSGKGFGIHCLVQRLNLRSHFSPSNPQKGLSAGGPDPTQSMSSKRLRIYQLSNMKS